MRPQWILALTLTACGNDVALDADAPPEPTVRTYWQDVEPIFQTNCVTCHSAGGIGPFAIDDPEIAAQYSLQIAADTAARQMPPWPPGERTPDLLHERTLSEEEIATIDAWAMAGAPIGDPADRRPHELPEVIDIGTPELAFDIGLDYVPDTGLTDDYRCFLAEVGTSELRVATGFRVTPGNRAIVHHVIVSMFDASDRAALEQLDAQTPTRAGWPCVGGAIPDTVQASPIGSLGSWVPGVSAVAFPAGTGTVVQPGALAVIQMHYNLAGGNAPDRTRVEVALAPTSQNSTLVRLGGVGLVKRNLNIASNDAASVHTQAATLQQWRALRGQQPFPSGFGYALGVGGHMHMIGTHITLSRTNANGETVLLDIPAWSFHWQGQYQLEVPVRIENTDTLVIRCEYDNSMANRLALGLTPGVAVGWGEGSEDEMCLGSIQLVDRLPAP